MSSYTTIFFSLLGGILPALLWLWFWLKEDRLHPEPKLRIILVFLTGMATVFFVLPLEKMVFGLGLPHLGLIIILLWASIEEIFKFLGAYITALNKRDLDEPIDAIIYTITVALGFSALENTLFLANLLDTELLSQSIITGNSRFIGATLLHVASSATIGVFMGLSHYKKPLTKKIFLLTGMSLAIVLHTAFNLLIIRLDQSRFFVFAGVWVLIILLFVLIEKVKTIRSPQQNNFN